MTTTKRLTAYQFALFLKMGSIEPDGSRGYYSRIQLFLQDIVYIPKRHRWRNIGKAKKM